MSGASFKLIPRDQPPRSDFAALPFHTDRRAPLSVGWSLMPICPMCHSTLTVNLDVRPSILPVSLWRCTICCDIWIEGGDVRPKPIHPTPSHLG